MSPETCHIWGMREGEEKDTAYGDQNSPITHPMKNIRNHKKQKRQVKLNYR